LAQAAVWGLLRAARAEHPARGLRLVDVSEPVDGAALARAIGASAEPELLVRKQAALAPRLERVPAGGAEETPWAGCAPGGTALITGGTGELGQALARHLVSAHGVRHLVLTSRRGKDAPGVAALIDELRALGAESVEVASCDVSVRGDVAHMVASVP